MGMELQRERRIIWLVGVMQFVNILDFMMVMPLGPDFALALGMPASDIGIIGGVYTFAASLAGLVAALFLDPYARKRMVMILLSGLVLATFAGALAWDKHSMIAMRLLAGIFGGPLMSVALALIADYVPPERRGRAMGKVAGAFAAASVLGVPFGLQVAHWFNWQAPFILTGILALGVLLLVMRFLPSQAALVDSQSFAMRVAHLLSIVRSRIALAAYGFMGIAMMSGFMIIPNIAAHLQMNVGYPREYLGLLYLSGGAVSFFSMRGAGWLVDKTSATQTVLLFTSILFVALGFGFVWFPSAIPVVVLFTLFMVAMSGRNVSAQTLASKIPEPAQRGAYMSVQSAVTHMASALGAYYSSLVLDEKEGMLLHMPTLGLTAMALSCVVPVLVWYVERNLTIMR